MIQNVIQKSQGDGFCSESVDCNCYGTPGRDEEDTKHSKQPIELPRVRSDSI